MRIFLAGSTGAVGRQLVPLLVREGHEVAGLCRNDGAAQLARSMGATPVIADALDDGALAQAVLGARPEVVIHQLTGLAGTAGNLRRFDQEFERTNRLRTQALDTMLKAARAAGAHRFIAQSFCGWPQARSGTWIKSESDPLEAHPAKEFRRSQAAIQHIESVVPAAAGLTGIVLRFGVLYGPGTNFAEDGSIVKLVRERKLPLVGEATGVWSFTHVEDAARATVAAVHRGKRGIYNIVDDDPAPVNEWLPWLAQALGAPEPRNIPAWLGRVALGAGGLGWILDGRGGSNAKAKRELGWAPRYGSWRAGFMQLRAAGQRAAA